MTLLKRQRAKWSEDTFADTHDLREIQGIIADRVEDQVLELVYHTKQILSERGHCCRCVQRFLSERFGV